MKRTIKQEEDKSVKRVCNEEEEYVDLLGYCRAWNIETLEQFWHKWIAHPQERVRLSIFGELAMYQSREAEDVEDQVRWVFKMWLHVKKVEERHARFKTLEEAVRYLEKEKIISLQDNI